MPLKLPPRVALGSIKAFGQFLNQADLSLASHDPIARDL